MTTNNENKKNIELIKNAKTELVLEIFELLTKIKKNIPNQSNNKDAIFCIIEYEIYKIFTEINEGI